MGALWLAPDVVIKFGVYTPDTLNAPIDVTLHEFVKGFLLTTRTEDFHHCASLGVEPFGAEYFSIPVVGGLVDLLRDIFAKRLVPIMAKGNLGVVKGNF